MWNHNGGGKKRDDAWIAASAERRFSRLTRPGEIPDRHPELGPCIIFIGSTDNGYGQFRYNRRQSYAHRYAWERANGPIPEGMTVDHLCYVRRCVNVNHMELVDAVTNFLRGAEQRPLCPKGHPYPSGRKMGENCKECYGGHVRKMRDKYRESREDLPDTRIRYDQNQVSAVIKEIQDGKLTIAQGARDIGCNPNYLGRRAWTATKKLVFTRDDNTCQRCEMRAGDVHHRIPRGIGGSADPRISFGMDNLISVCRVCHDWIHHHPTAAKDAGYIVSSSSEPEHVPLITKSGLLTLRRDGTTFLAGSCAEPYF